MDPGNLKSIGIRFLKFRPIFGTGLLKLQIVPTHSGWDFFPFYRKTDLLGQMLISDLSFRLTQKNLPPPPPRNYKRKKSRALVMIALGISSVSKNGPFLGYPLDQLT